jgi:SAM-dependent methyltransferase
MSKIISNLLKDKEGLEIGKSSWNNYCINAKNVDIANRQGWVEVSKSMKQEPAKVDYLCDGSNILVSDNSQDFVFSSHMIEHHPNPIALLVEWYRVIKNGGDMVAVIPLRTASPSDIGKPLTSLEELIDRDYNPDKYVVPDPNVHQTIWDTTSFDTLINYGLISKLWNYKLVTAVSPDDHVGNGFIVAYKVVKEKE